MPCLIVILLIVLIFAIIGYGAVLGFLNAALAFVFGGSAFLIALATGYDAHYHYKRGNMWRKYLVWCFALAFVTALFAWWQPIATGLAAAVVTMVVIVLIWIFKKDQ